MFYTFTEGEQHEAACNKCDSCECESLKKQIKEQGDDIVLLKSALADAVRRIQELEAKKHTSGKYWPI
jgi:hypothetical protein